MWISEVAGVDLLVAALILELLGIGELILLLLLLLLQRGRG